MFNTKRPEIISQLPERIHPTEMECRNNKCQKPEDDCSRLKVKCMRCGWSGCQWMTFRFLGIFEGRKRDVIHGCPSCWYNEELLRETVTDDPKEN